MNDRFGSQLRQHLLNTADEHPADGQLAAVTERVAATTQRRPFVARLTLNPGRIGAFPATAVRYGLVAVALALVTVVAAGLMGGTPRAPSTVFEGMWTSIDPGDGSTQTLSVGAGSRPAVQFVDEYASGPACTDDPVKRFTADGTGVIVGNHMDVTFPDGGGCGSRKVFLDGPFDYHQATDTLVGGDGVEWTRMPDREVPDSQAPPTPIGTPVESPFETPVESAAAEPTPLVPEPTEATSCTRFDAEGVYTARAGTLPVGVAVPATASSPWSGLLDEFALTNAPCGGDGSLTFTAGLVANVYTDSCHWKGTNVEAPTVRDLFGKLLTQAGHETDPAPETHLGAFKAQSLTLSVAADFDAATCDVGMLALWETPTGTRTIDPGTTMQVYVAEVDGVTLVLTAAYRTADATPDLLAEIDALVASLRIDM